MKDNLNIIITPYSFISGMAHANRLFNFYKIFKSSKIVYKINNLVLSPGKTSYAYDQIKTSDCKFYSISYSKNPFSYIKYLILTYWYLMKIREKECTNVLIFYGYISLDNFHLIYFAKKLGFKIIVDIVEDRSTIKEFKSLKNMLKIKSSVYFLNKIGKYADGITTISIHLQKKIKEILDNENILVYLFPVTVDFKDFKTYSSHPPNKSNVKRIFYGGSFAEKDGLNYLLRAIANITKEYDVRLYLTGIGDKTNMDKFFKLVDELNIRKVIHFKGFLNRSRYYELLNSCDILCMTRIDTDFAKAGFPFKLGEYLASNKPVVCTRIGDIPKFVAENEVLFISPRSIKEIEMAIIKIIKNPIKYNEMAERGFIKAKKHFNYLNYSKSYLQFIVQSIKNSSNS